MMINPTKRQLEIFEMYDREVAPWTYGDMETLEIKLREDAPEDIKKKYELFMNC